MPNKKHRHPGPVPHKLSQNEILDRISRNGLTLKDLQAYYERGVREGFMQGYESGWEQTYGSLLYALHEHFGWGQQRIGRLVMAANEIQVNHLTADETYDKLLSEVGIDLPRIRDIYKNGEFIDV